MLIVSRMPRRLSSLAEWLKSARTAVEFLERSDCPMVSGIGGIWWDYPLWYANIKGLPLVVVHTPVCDQSQIPDIDSLLHPLNLAPNRTTVIIPLIKKTLGKEDSLHLRDKIVYNLATQRYVLVIRKGGYWHSVLANDPTVDRRFTAPYPHELPLEWKTLISPATILQPIENVNWDDYLIHWTRGYYAPFPGESLADYFTALTANPSGNPRDGLATLAHIAQEGIIRGSGNITRGGEPVVSLTALPPHSFPQLLHYRYGFKRWTMEPFGIAIPRTRIVSAGGLPVTYGKPSEYSKLPTAQKPFFQAKQSARASQQIDWSNEAEVRIIGDFDFSPIRNEVIFITPSSILSNYLRTTCKHHTVSFDF